MPIVHMADGLDISYEVRGEGPLAVVFQHGWGSTSRFFDRMLEHLPVEGRTFVALDLAGHGASSDHRDAHGVEPYARQLLAVADHAGLSRFVTVGHSMGGKFNQYLRLIAPDRLSGSVSLAPSPAGLATEEASDEAIGYLASLSGNPEGMAAMLRTLMTQQVPDTVVTSWAESAARIPSSVLAASMRAIGHTDFENELVASGVVPPTLVIAGRNDPIYALDKVRERIQREAPHAVFRVLDCGHDIPNERPLESALLVDGFLAAIGSDVLRDQPRRSPS